MKKSSDPKPSDKELAKLGAAVQQFIDYGYIKRKQVLWFTFLKGLVTGFGVFLGGTILVLVLLWILGLFQHIPLISPFIHTLSKTIQANK